MTQDQELSAEGKQAMIECQAKDGTVSSLTQTFIGHALDMIDSDKISNITIKIRFSHDSGEYYPDGYYIAVRVAEADPVEIHYEV
jgi:hypothetical protein